MNKNYFLIILLLMLIIFITGCAKCGDNICQPAEERRDTCPEDCETEHKEIIVDEDITECGNGVCDEGEICEQDCKKAECQTNADCPQLGCYPCPDIVCIDGKCVKDPNYVSPECGNNICEKGEEDASGIKGACPQDCGKILEKPPQEIIEEKDDSEESQYNYGSGEYAFTFNHQGGERRYIVHVPKDYDAVSPFPVVLVLHGGGGKAEGLDKLSGFSDKADKENFIVVYPEGTSKPVLKTAHLWNAGGCESIPNAKCSNQATEAGADDVGYINKVLDDIKSKFNIDAKRIYATGFSNGAQMTHRLGCEMSERLAAIAPVSGTLLYTTCNPTRKIPVLYIQARNDENVPYDGGTGKCTGKEFSWPSVQYTMDFWLNNHGLMNLSPVIVYEKNTAHCESYMDQDTEIQQCTIEPNPIDWRIGGHSWPGGPVENVPVVCPLLLAVKCACISTKDLNATEYIWEFFEKHPMPG